MSGTHPCFGEMDGVGVVCQSRGEGRWVWRVESSRMPSTWAHDERNKVRSLLRRRLFHSIPRIHLYLPPSGRSLSRSSFCSHFADHGRFQAPIRWCKYVLPSLYCAYIATVPLAPRRAEQSPPAPSQSAKEDDSAAPAAQNEVSHAPHPLLHTLS